MEHWQILSRILGLSQPLQAKGGRVNSFGRDYIFFRKYLKFLIFQYFKGPLFDHLPSNFFGYAAQLHSIFLSPLPISFFYVSFFFTLFVSHLQTSVRNEYQVAHPHETKKKTVVLYVFC